MKFCMRFSKANYKKFTLAAFIALSLSLRADYYEDDNELDSLLPEWNPDVTSFQDFGSGKGPSSDLFTDSDKFYSFDPLPKAESSTSANLIAAEDPSQLGATGNDTSLTETGNPRTILINFNNVAITEFIRFISRVSGKNFIYEEPDLQFNVTIISDEPASLENVLAALMQILRINGLMVVEQGNNILIHKNPKINNISRVVSSDEKEPANGSTELVTQVFKLNTLDTERAAKLIRPLASDTAIVDEIPQSSNIVVTDLATNVQKIGQLLKNLDSPATGLIIGQYQVTSAIMDSLIPLAEKIMEPIAEGKPLVLVPHTTSNSIFIVSTPFLVERSIAVLRNLDANTGSTRIFSEDNLRFNGGKNGLGADGLPSFGNLGGFGGPNDLDSSPEFDAQGRRLRPPRPGEADYRADGSAGGSAGQSGGIGNNSNQRPFQQGYGGGTIGTQSNLDYQQRQQGFNQGAIGPNGSWNSSLPVGHIQRTQFYIQKLKYRRGDQITEALQRIADSLGRTGQSNADLVSTIQSIQWIEASNSLVFTGISEAILKVRELINEIDSPLRQVFIEMLILDATLDDALEYGVNWGARFGGGNQAGAENFVTGTNPLAAGLNTTGVGLIPSAVGMVVKAGYSLGILGQRITHHGTEYASIGALVRATHNKTKSNIVMNPKILTEDNVPAEIFVGENIRFQTQAISNDQGSIVTNNFEYRDVGTTLKVTPLISNTDVITLEIKQEVSRILPNTDSGTGGLVSVSAGPSTSKNTTTTRVHIPNKYFLVISGMIQDEKDRIRTQLPCLGGAPIIGALASEKQWRNQKRNLMIFIRPEIIDTNDEIEHLTRHQQNLYRQKQRTNKMWQFEVDEAMDWMNIQKPDNTFNDREEFNP